ncbi:unnamed protein product, partial [Didymodactylos carnosus]
MRRPTQLL